MSLSGVIDGRNTDENWKARDLLRKLVSDNAELKMSPSALIWVRHNKYQRNVSEILTRSNIADANIQIMIALGELAPACLTSTA